MIQSLVFGRPWLNPISVDVLNGFDLGRFAVALLCSDQVVIHLNDFSTLAYLIDEIGRDTLIKLFEKKLLKILCRPEGSAFITSPDGHSGLASFLYDPHKWKMIEDPNDFGKLIRTEINGNKFFDVNVKLNTALIISENSQVILDIQRKIHNQIGLDLLDEKFKLKLDSFFKNYFSVDYSLLDFLEVTSKNGHHYVSVIKSEGLFPDKEKSSKLSTLILILGEAYSLLDFANFTGSNNIFTDAVIFELSNLILSNKLKDSLVPLKQVLDTSTNHIEIPDIEWLVNRKLVDFQKIIRFRNSKNGFQFREFISMVIQPDVGQKIDLIKKTNDSIIKSFHKQNWWESTWDSKVGKYSRITLTTSLGFMPVIGTILGLGATAADSILSEFSPKTFKPTLILNNEIKRFVDQEKIPKQKEVSRFLPSLAKLKRQGCKPVIAFDLGDNLKKLILKTSNNETYWSIEIDTANPQDQKYYESFLEMFPPKYSTEYQLLDLLGLGWEMEETTIYYDERKIEYVLSKNGETKNICGETNQFWLYATSREILLDPNEFYDFKNKYVKD